ncbi:histidinol-phosphate transaminase [Motilimonas sp. 1_MG-2023]|uniref:histidinol-phosphate transaminase n=1 Tax=Motilimonas sp. 1_MG-2023 TaxID=3062672 RepID=UPI0026E26DEA|nr:histidinol-phosphate transaminase [Motilimonas sp. 1_MG-2023]MDO6524684.1 histidinol-phosphate transaminase [Motilimonas sp. 1_MG-2023]
MSCDFVALANTGVQGLHPYQAGKPVDELERELGLSNIVKLASNENPLGPSDAVKAAISAELAELTRYPDANGYDLKTALANKYQINTNQITLGNGSNDVLEILARTFVSAQHEVIFSQYAFVVYPLVTQSIGAKAVAVAAKDWGHDLDAMASAITDKTKMIFIANPNNPTGTCLSSAQLLAFLAKVPSHIIVVLDEAYYEYADEQADSVAWLKQYPNLVITRTFSKAYGLAALRVGYAMSNDVIADLLNRVRQPFNCNSLAIAAACAALQDSEYLARSVALNQQGMKDLESFFTQYDLPYIPSKGNFITFDTGRDANPVYNQLLQLGVIVRPIGGYGMPNHLRVSIGTEQENQTFKTALINVLELGK